jgi:hypothetical protein
MLFVKSRQQLRKEVRRHRGAGSNAQDAAFESSECTKFLLGDPRNAEQLSRTCEKCLASLGESRCAPRAIEQRETSLALELLNGLGHGGLTQSQRDGGPRKAAMLSHRRENTQVMQIECHNYKEY